MRIIPDGAKGYEMDYHDPFYGIGYNQDDTIEISDDVDWTIDKTTNNSNSSKLFNDLCTEVEQLIRNDAHILINGHAERTARLIMAQLAHKHKLIPIQYLRELSETGHTW
jgi:hypothetical protein